MDDKKCTQRRSSHSGFLILFNIADNISCHIHSTAEPRYCTYFEDCRKIELHKIRHDSK